MNRLIMVMILFSESISFSTYAAAETINAQQISVTSSRGDSTPQGESGKNDQGGLKPDPQEVFKTILNDLLLLSTRPNIPKDESDRLVDQMVQFTKNYPDSVYVKDARIIVQCFLFEAALGNKDKQSALNAISEIEKIADIYPGALLEEYTYKLINAFNPEDAPGWPFQYLPYYLRGHLGLDFKDYQYSIDNFNFIKDKMVTDTDVKKLFMQNVYNKLIQAYIFSDRLIEARITIKELLQKYPDSPFTQQLEETLRQLPEEASIFRKTKK